MMAAGNPNWWSINSMHPQESSSNSSQYLYGSSPLLSSTNIIPLALDDDDTHHQEYPRSWSQLLIGGLANDPEDMLAATGSPNYHEYKRLDQNWEGPIVTNPCFRGVDTNSINNNCGDVKLESSLLYDEGGGTGGGEVDEFHRGVGSSSNRQQPSWSQLIMSNSSPISSVTCLSSTTSSLLNFSGINNSCNMLERRIQHPADSSSECNSSKAVISVAKKPKIQHSTTQTSLKVRKEKLGDRITALHQLVSPFGKTDTASVLSESVGYIRFLQAQIQALSSPYLGNVAPRSMGHPQSFDTEDRRPKDLRSRGLCLVPVSCTIHVANDNGADYWAPPPGRGF